MKRKILIIMIVIFAVSLIYIMSKSYSINEAIKNGDFINYPSVTNYNKFEEFLKDIDINKNTKLRITTFSKEGKPVIQDLVYENESFICSKYERERLFDNRLETYYFTELIYKESNRFIEYYFIDNEKNEKVLLVQIPK